MTRTQDSERGIRDVLLALSEVVQNLEPKLKLFFLPPADPYETFAAEKELGLTFPDDLRQLYTVTNGQDFPSQTADPIFPAVRFHGKKSRAELNTGDIMSRTSPTWLNSVSKLVENTKLHRDEYEDLEACAKEFRIHGPARYHDKVIGFTSTENSDSLVLDLAPTEGGTVGQVVMIRTQPFEIGVLAPSLLAFMTYVLDGYKNGSTQFDEQWGWCDL